MFTRMVNQPCTLIEKEEIYTLIYNFIIRFFLQKINIMPYHDRKILKKNMSLVSQFFLSMICFYIQRINRLMFQQRTDICYEIHGSII